jgi:hypothetical protein
MSVSRMSLFSSIHSNHEEPWPRAAGTAGAAAGASAVQPYKLQPEVGFLRPRIAEGEGFSARGRGAPARFPRVQLRWLLRRYRRFRVAGT